MALERATSVTRLARYKQGGRLRDLARAGCSRKRFFCILLCLDSRACSTLHFACLFAASRLTSLLLDHGAAQMRCEDHYHIHISHGRDPSFASTPTAVFSRHGVFPRPPEQHTWQSYTASPVVRTKRVVAPGRHMLHQVLVILVQRCLQVGSDEHA